MRKRSREFEAVAPLRIETNKSLLFKDIVTLTSFITKEGHLQFLADGVHIHAQDMSHVSFLAVHLRTNNFKQYNIKEAICHGQSFAELKSIVKGVQSNEVLSIQHVPQKKSLVYVFDGTRRTMHRLSALQLKLNTDPVPKIEFTASVRMRSTEFYDIITCQGYCSSITRIEMRKDRVLFVTSNEHRTCTSVVRGKKTNDKPEEGPTRTKNNSEEEEEDEEQSEEDDGQEETKNEHKKPKPQPSEKLKANETDEDLVDDEDWKATIVCPKPFYQHFINTHLQTFAKAKISDDIKLHMCPGQGLMIEYLLADDTGTICFYVRNKIID